MKDWTEKLNGFLQLNDRNILEHAGKVSRELAKQLAEAEYDKFNRDRIALNDAEDSDFDEVVRQIEGRKDK